MIYNSLKTIELLFGSKEKLDILRYCMRYHDYYITKKDIERDLEIKKDIVNITVKWLVSIEILLPTKDSKSEFTVQTKNPFYTTIESLVFPKGLFLHNDLKKKIMSIGHVSFILAAGCLIGAVDSRVDLLVGATKVKQKELQELIVNITQLHGREVTYCVLDPKEIKYRKDVNDRFIRDVFDGEFIVLYDEMSISV